MVKWAGRTDGVRVATGPVAEPWWRSDVTNYRRCLKCVSPGSKPIPVPPDTSLIACHTCRHTAKRAYERAGRRAAEQEEVSTYQSSRTAKPRGRPRRWSTGPEGSRERARLKSYGLTPEEYRTWLADLDGRCMVCTDQPSYQLHVDHDHLTGAVRGLLCRPCNHALGFLRDSITRAKQVVDYLFEAQKQTDPLARVKKIIIQNAQAQEAVDRLADIDRRYGDNTDYP